MSVSTTMITHSGRMVDLLDVKPEDINLDDIAHALAHTNRFIGHARRPYSVAEHSINVARLLPEPIKIYGLMHDAHEAYIGDISTPMKRALDDSCPVRGDVGFTETLSRFTAAVDSAIYTALEVPPPGTTIEQAVKYADAIMGVKELQELFANPPPDAKRLPLPRWSFGEGSFTPNYWAKTFRVEFYRLSDELRAAA